MEEFWPFRCPQCGETVDRSERVYDEELDMDMCALCAENLRDERMVKHDIPDHIQNISGQRRRNRYLSEQIA
jgi:NAD-dependent SIR2 family protein deacetylase